MKMGIKTIIKQSDGATGRSRLKASRPAAPDPGGTHERRVSWRWASVSVVALLTAMAVAALTMLSRTGLEMAERQGPLIYASMKIKYELSLFHLWFEELVQGDPYVSEEDVWSHLSQARWYANAMLEGGQKPKGAILSLTSRELRDSIADTLKEMDALGDIGRVRLAMSDVGGIGSVDDQRFDAVFFVVLKKADKVEAVLQRTIAASIERFNVLRTGIIVGLILFGGAAGVGIFVYQRRHRLVSERLSETDAIRQSEERLRNIFETSPIGVSIFVPKTNKRLYMNPAMVKLFGAESEEQLLEQNIAETWADPSDLNRLREMDKNDFVEEIETKRLRLDGTVWWSHLHRRRIEFEGQNAIMNWHYDISERKKAEQKIKRINEDLELRVEERTKELQKSEALFRAVVNHSPAKIHIKDTDGRYTLINKEAEKLFGVTDEEGRGKTSYDLFEKDVADAFIDHDRAVIESGESVEEEEKFTLDDGVHTYLTTKFPIFDQDGITGIGSIGVDITERKRVEEALQESENRLRRSVLDAPNPIMIHADDGEVLMISKSWTELSGYSHSDIPNILDWTEKAYGFDKDKMRERIGSLYEIQEPYEDESFVTTASGEQRIWDFRTAPLGRLPDGRLFVISMAVDVTELKDKEKAVREKAELVELLRRVAVSANESQNVDEVFKFCLDQVCAYTGWPIGHVYMLDDEGSGELLSMKIWHLDHPGRFKTFRRVSEKIRFAPGIGLPGRVLTSGIPAWIEDVNNDPNFPRAKLAKNIGVKAGFAFPVLVGRDAVAVLEFFSTEAVKPNKEMLSVMEPIGTQIGRVIERTRAEEALRDSEERKGLILESSLEAIITIDDDGRVIEFNAAAEGMFGYTDDEAKGRNIDDLIIPPNMSEKHRRGLAMALKAGRRKLFENRLEFLALRADGREFPVEITVTEFEMAGRKYFTSFIRDVSERKQTEEELRKLSQAIEQSPVSIVITDLNAIIEYVNLKFVEVTGYSSDEAIGKNPKMLKSSINPPELYEDLWGKLTSGQEWRGELCNKKKNGELYWEYAIISPLKAPDGRVTHYIAANEDITEHKVTEEALRQSQKMEALGQLTGGIAHDFNNLLGIVLGHLELVQRVDIKDNEMREDINVAHKAALRGANLTRQLLDFSRHNPRRTRFVNINLIIERMKGLLVKSLTSEIDIVFHLADGLWATELDVSDLENAILNMSINAHDAMSKGGVLTIKTENKIFNQVDAAAIPELLPGKYVVLSVSDTGSGMSQKRANRVFEPFFTTKELGKGTGLGLSTVFGFVKRSGGYITVDSKLGQGTTFWINLPKSPFKPENLAPTEMSEIEMPGGMETILVVDDETQLLNSTTKILKSLGYTVYCAKDAHQALETLKNKGNIDLLFSDVVMPGKMNGFELARHACEKDPDLKVLITSGFEQNAFKKAPYSYFSKNLIAKPYRMTELATRIRATLDTGN